MQAECPPSRAELRKLKSRQRDRRRYGKELSPEDQARMDQLLADRGEEYPVEMRRGMRRMLLRLLNSTLNSDGKGNP